MNVKMDFKMMSWTSDGCWNNIGLLVTKRSHASLLIELGIPLYFVVSIKYMLYMFIFFFEIFFVFSCVFFFNPHCILFIFLIVSRTNFFIVVWFAGFYSFSRSRRVSLSGYWIERLTTTIVANGYCTDSFIK